MRRSFRTAALFAAFTCICTLPVLAGEVGMVVRINGAPARQQGDKIELLQRGTILSTGDVIVTDGNAKVKILLVDDSVLTLGPRTRTIVDELVLEEKSRTGRLQVLTGRFKLAIAKYFGGRTDYEIRTPTAVAGVRGTVMWGDTDLDAICALDGDVEVRPRTGAAAPARLSTGDCVSRMATGKTAPLKPSPEDLAGYLKEVTLD